MHEKPPFELQLRALQKRFVGNLTGKRVDPVFLDQLGTVQGVSVARNFSIYVNNRRVGLLKALANTYPVCQKLVGERYFQKMVNTYLEQHPSYSPSLNDYGFCLAEALMCSPFVLGLPYLIDIIHLEWDIHRILIGADERLFDWSTLALISSAQYTELVFHRPKNSALMHSSFPVDRIWEANQTDFVGDDFIDLTEGEVFLFVQRVSFDLRIERLTALQWAILNAIDGKRSLEALRTVLAGKAEVQTIIESLPALIKAGYIFKFDL